MEKHKSDVDVSAVFLAVVVVALSALVVVLVFHKSDTSQAKYSPLVIHQNETPTPVQIVVDVVQATPTPTPFQPDTPTPFPVPTFEGEDLPGDYAKVTILGRFSNYWPDLGGTNCQGECELFADGTRKDQALAEGERVVACPPELLLGTRIEYPPNSGLVWTCRDRGGDITFYYSENGTPIYWFDFLSPIPWVDYGSYIQVDVWVPRGQVLP